MEQVWIFFTRLKPTFKLLLVAVFVGISCFSEAQTVTKIVGTVIDAGTKEPIPFASIYFKGSSTGTTAGFDGKFAIETRFSSDSLVAACLGYFTHSRAVKKNVFQTINFEMRTSGIQLDEVVVVAGENPADIILRKVIANKPNNDPDKVDAFQCEAYTKMQLDMNNISERIQNHRALKQFQFVLNYLDTSIVNGKAYLPVMLSEALSDVYYRKSPRERKEIINASKISGIENASIAQFAGTMAQDIKIYDNFISIFQKNFASPISGMGFLYYKYYLIDSSLVENHWCYNIMFKPRNKQEYAFTGNIWVNDTTFAIAKLEMRMNSNANINMVNDFKVDIDFEKIDNQQWMVTREKVVIDFNLMEDSKKMLGFFGSRTVIYQNYKLQSASQEIYSMPSNVVVRKNALEQDAEFWNQERPEQLSEKESNVYTMVDSLESIPLFDTYKNIFSIIFAGYYIKGNFEWGPYGSIFSYNAIEGTRIRLGGRTSNDFSKRLKLESYVAYGFLDKRFKYNAGIRYMINKMPDRVFMASYQYDMKQLGESSGAFREDFFLNSLFRRNPQDKLSMLQEIKIAYKHEWFSGFSNTITFENARLYNLGRYGIELYNSELDKFEIRDKLTTTAIQFATHFGYREKVIAGEFERTTISSPYPVFDLRYTYGIPHLFDSDLEYHRLQFNTSHWFNWLSLGRTKYAFEVGKIWGQVPFPLMKIHSGNETFWFDGKAFNLMNYFEFVSDSYLDLMVVHHFGGFFFNRIPLLNKLKWREVVQMRAAIGATSNENMKYNRFPQGTYSLERPYFEAGVGIENIFRFVRVDAVWRLSHNNLPRTNKFSLMVSFNFAF